MAIKLSPTNDYIFKRIFGAHERTALLVNLVNASLGLSGKTEVERLDLLNPYVPGESMTEKLSILDIRARDRLGRSFLVEMQILAYPAFAERILYYWAGGYREQLHGGESYEELKPAYSICILDFNLFPQSPAWRHQFSLVDAANGVRFSNQLEIVTLELPKFQTSVERLKDDLDRWAWFLKNARDVDRLTLPTSLQTPTMTQAVEYLELMSQSTYERQAAEDRENALRLHNTLIGSLRKARQQAQLARHEGREEGMREEKTRNLLSRIKLLQKLQGSEMTMPGEFSALSLEELEVVANGLEEKVLASKST